MTEDRTLRAAGIGVLCLLLGACVAGPTGAPPPATTQGAPRANTAMPPARGVTSMVVRATVLEGGVPRDLAGATCDLASPYTTARFATPATVSVPDLGSASPPVTVTCASGKLRGAAQAQPAAQVADTGMSGWPAIGISVGTGTGGWSGGGVSVGGFWNGGSGNGYWTKVVYPDLTIPLR